MALAGLSDQRPPDWSAPWFQPWRTPAQAVTCDWLAGERLVACLERHQVWTAPGPRPVEDGGSGLPGGSVAGSFEQRVAQTGTLPIRSCWHDAFNALVWARMPLFKNAINDAHVRELRAGGGSVRGRRSPARDFATLLDENGVLLSAPPQVWDALVRRDWVRLFWSHRALWAQVQVLVIGHALLDQLRAPRLDLTAHVWIEPMPPLTQPTVGRQWDQWAASALERCLSEHTLTQKPLSPLPLMGIPGWCEGNASRAFYDNDRVFRPPRMPHAPKGSPRAMA